MSLVWTDPCQTLATVRCAAETEALIFADEQSELLVELLDGGLGRDPHAVVPDLVVGHDRAQHVGHRRGEQCSSAVGTAHMTDLPGAGGVRAVNVEELQFDRHGVLTDPDLRHLRERTHPVAERLGRREALHADHVELEARCPYREAFEPHVERLADLEADVVHEPLISYEDDIVVNIGMVSEVVAEESTRGQAGQERASGSQRDDPVVLDGSPQGSLISDRFAAEDVRVPALPERDPLGFVRDRCAPCRRGCRTRTGCSSA